MKASEDIGRGMGGAQQTVTARLQSVELIRFFAAVSVILWHYPIYFFVAVGQDVQPLRSPELFPLSGLLSVFYGRGYYAVPWFWVLSGYIFFFNYRDVLADRALSGFAFFARRFARLYPLHVATLLAVALLLPSYQALFGARFPVYAENSTAWAFVSQLFMASNWLSLDYSFNGPIWSVSIEVLIYVLFFFLASYAKIRGLIKTLGVTVACLVLYYLATKMLSVRALTAILQCAVCFYLGGVVCEIREYLMRGAIGGIKRVVFWVLVAAAVYGFYLFRPTYAVPFFIPASVILFVVSSETIERSRLVAKLAHVGNWTYSSYLLHFPVALLIVIGMGLLGLRPAVIAQQPLFLIAFVGLVFVLSELCYKYFEAPARRALRNAAKVKGA